VVYRCIEAAVYDGFLPKVKKGEKRRTRCHFAQTRLVFLAKALNLYISFDNKQAGGYTYFI